MSLITWSEEYSVNIKEIDNQHRQLVEMLNELHRSMRSGQSGQVLGNLLQRLVDYTEYHFSTEERIMEVYNYPGYIHHKAEHAALTRQVQEFQKQYKQNPTGLGVQLMNFFKTWLVDHIVGTDKKYTKYLNSQGVN